MSEQPGNVIEFGPRQAPEPAGQPVGIPIGQGQQGSAHDINFDLTIRKNALTLADEMIRISETLEAGPRRDRLKATALELIDNMVLPPTG